MANLNLHCHKLILHDVAVFIVCVWHSPHTASGAQFDVFSHVFPISGPSCEQIPGMYPFPNKNHGSGQGAFSKRQLSVFQAPVVRWKGNHSLVHFIYLVLNFWPTNGLSIKPLKVKL